MSSPQTDFTPPLLNLPVTMPDGVTLTTDVYRVANGLPAPVVLMRTPYGKHEHFQEGLGWVRHGFACVVQDVRGRYDSGGDWQPYEHERADGRATLAWLLAQDWCDGRIIVVGSSYAAFTAWALAVTNHPALRAIISAVPAMGLTTVQFGEAGIFQLASRVAWWLNRGAGRTQRPGLFETLLSQQPDILMTLPVSDIPERLGVNLPIWVRELQRGADYKGKAEYAVSDDEVANVQIPALHLGGWHDAFIGQTLHQWKIAGGALAQRPAQSLIIGAWGHELNQTTTYGSRDYGADAKIPLGKLQVQWLRAVLGNSPDPAKTNQTRLFLMGRNTWLSEANGLKAVQQERIFYAANGILQDTLPDEQFSLSFIYDPADPYPTRFLPQDESKLPPRRDVAVFTTAPLDYPLTILGRPTVELFGASDAPATDWVVRLLEVTPQSEILPLGTAILDTGRQRQKPGSYWLALPTTAIEIGARSRLRLEITSSNFPQYARNPNLGQNRYTSTQMRSAQQTIYAGGATPTRLILPLLTEEKAEVLI
jgi:uncharacterized protein